MKHAISRWSGQMLCIVLIIVGSVPAYGYTTPWMHAPEYDGGWDVLRKNIRFGLEPV